jgi:hypothetical protein
MAKKTVETLVLDVDDKKLVKGSQSAKKSLDDLKKSGKKSGDDLEKNAEKNFGGVKDAAEDLSSQLKDTALGGLGPLGKAAGSLKGPLGGAALAIGATVAAVGGLTLGILKLVDANKMLRANEFKFESKGGKEGLQTLKEIREFARDTGQPLEESELAIRKLYGAFGDTQSAKEAFKVISDISAIGGGSVQDIEGLADEIASLAAVTELGQGDIDGFKERLGSAAPGAKELAKILGTSQDDIEKSLKEGTLSSADYAAALRVSFAQGGDAANAGANAIDKAAKDPGAQLEKLKTSVALVGKSFEEALFTPENVKGFKDLADSIIGVINSEEFKSNVKSLADSIATTFGFIRNTFSGFKSFVSDTFKAVKEVFGPALDVFSNGVGKTEGKTNSLVKILGGLWEIIKFVGKALILTVGTAIGGFIVGIQAIAYVLDMSLQGLEKLGLFLINDLPGYISKAADWFWNLPESLIEVIADMHKSIFGFVGGFFGIGQDTVNGFVDGIKSMALAPVKAIKEIAGNVLDGFKSVLGIHSPSVEMRLAAEDTVSPITDTLDDTKTPVKKASEQLGEATIMGYNAGTQGPQGVASNQNSSVELDASRQSVTPQQQQPITVQIGEIILQSQDGKTIDQSSARMLERSIIDKVISTIQLAQLRTV